MIRFLSFVVLPMLTYLFISAQTPALAIEGEALFTSVTKAEVMNTPILAPTTFLLLGGGLTGWAHLARRRKKT